MRLLQGIPAERERSGKELQCDTTATDRILREMYLGRNKEEANRSENQGTSTFLGLLTFGAGIIF